MNHAIRFIKSGVISRVAGTLGSSGFGGDGLPGTSAGVLINKPMSLVYETGGGLFVSLILHIFWTGWGQVFVVREPSSIF